MNISWEDEYLYDYLNENTELFEKTSEGYHFLNLNRQPGQSTESWRFKFKRQGRQRK